MFKLEGGSPRPEQPGLAPGLGGWREWLSFILLFTTLEICVLSLERAHWITPQPALSVVLVLAMLVVRLLTVTRLPGAAVHLLTLASGALVTFWQVHGLMSYDTFYFAVFLAFIIWLVGYLSAWFLLRKKNAWVGVILGTLIILVNLSNLPGGYYWYFGLFFAAAAITIMQTRLARGVSSAEAGAHHAGRGLLYFVCGLLVAMVLATSIAWVTPTLRIPQFQTMIATRISWKSDFENSRFNIFADVPSKQSLNTNSMRLKLPFEASWHQSDRIDFVVKADRPSYWQVRAYDVYTTEGWENSPVTDFTLKTRAPWTGTAPPPMSELVTYTVTPDIMTDVLLTSGSFISTNKPVQVQVSADAVIGVLSAHVLSAGESYTVTAAAATTSPEALGRAGEDYPTWVLASYLQLPPDFPESIRELSARITADATTPYQEVLKINEYLSGIPYETDIEEPPEGTDGVAYFLFTQKSGFCVHFASAMAVMLRSVGVPTRLAIGYLPGEPSSEKGEYVLRDKLYHAWPQVYFPGYGWVDIEATPSGSESAGSVVPLDEPLISSENIQELPQWDVWSMAVYGLYPPIDAGGAAVPAAESPRSPYRHWVFAARLGQALLIVVGSVIVLAVVLGLWLLVRSSFDRWVWRVDRENLASETYKKICHMGAMLKIGPRPQQTPLEYAAVLAVEFPEQAQDLQEITQAYLESRFGGRGGKADIFNEARLLKARRRLFERLMSRLGQVEKIFRGRL